jgi:uncharacterized protein
MVTLDAIPPEGLELALNLAPEEVAAVATAEGQERPAVTSALTGQLKVKRHGSRRLSLRGSFQVGVVMMCDRCLSEKETELRGEVDELVNLALPGEAAGEDEDDDGALPVSDGRVDLRGLLAEFFWLAWPFRFLCRQDCAGLCPRCGADLNGGPCGCDDMKTTVN